MWCTRQRLRLFTFCTRKHFIVFIGLACMFIICHWVYTMPTFGGLIDSASVYITIFPTPDNVVPKIGIPIGTKTISYGTYLWTAKLPWGEDVYGEDLKCEKPCIIIPNPMEADGVLFFMWSMKFTQIAATQAKRLRKQVNQYQKWALMNSESPVSQAMFSTGSLTQFNNLFDVAISFDSRHMKSGLTTYGGCRLQTQEEMALTINAGKPKYSDKNQLVMGVISSCDKNSGRIPYIQALSNHITAKGKVIKVYGSCLDGSRCEQKYGADNCTWDYHGRHFKFYLAFENSKCRDYITEKLWYNALHHDMVPIVNGGLSRKDYEHAAPPKSFIHTDDFESPEHLANYIIYLDANEAKYAEYFKWKTTHVMFNTDPIIPDKNYYNGPHCANPKNCRPRSNYCEFCHYLHSGNSTTPSKRIQDVDELFGVEKNCRKKDVPYSINSFNIIH